MKTRLLCTLLAAAALVVGCKKGKELSEYEKNEQLRWSKIDLTGAEYLMQSSGPAGKSTKNNNDLFKVDKEGKMTAVVFQFEYRKDENGNRVSQEVRTDLKVVPGKMQNIDNGQYVLFSYCAFVDAQGEEIYIQEYWAGGPSFLVRTKDGAVFRWTFDSNSSELSNPKVDPKGDLFFCLAGEKISRIRKVEFQDDQAVIKALTPPELDFGYFVLTDHADTFLAWWESPYLFYPNGGFEIIKEERYDDERIITVGTAVKRVKSWYESVRQNDHTYIYYDTVQINNINITNAPPYTESTPVQFTRSGAKPFVGWSEVIECKNHYVLAGLNELLACHKSDNSVFKWERVPKLEFDGQLVGTTKMNLDTEKRLVQKYDFETFTYTEVPYNADQFGAFVSVKQPELSPDAKTYTAYGVRNSDGRSMILTIDTQTGAVKMTEAPENKTITTLIRLN